MAVKIAYAVTDDPGIGDVIRMTGLDYYRKSGGWAHGSNRNAQGEPYNYYDELMDFMRRKGFPELMEGMWGLPAGKLSILQKKLAAAGYELTEVPLTSDMEWPFGNGPFGGPAG